MPARTALGNMASLSVERNRDGNETGTQLVSRLGRPALRTNLVAQAQLARRPLHLRDEPARLRYPERWA